jgi:hemolysin activation/secretion protein
MRTLRSASIGYSLCLLASQQVFADSEITVSGISQELLNQLSIITDGSTIDLEQSIQHQLESKGYFLATVHLTSDSAIEVDLGHVAEVRIQGVSEKSGQAIAKVIQPLIDRHANQIAEFDHAQEVINDLPGLKASFAFEPIPDAPGFLLSILGEEIKQQGHITIDNIPRELGEKTRTSLSQDFYSVFQGGDALRFDIASVNGKNPDSTNLDLSYQIPISASGSYLELDYSDFEERNGASYSGKSYGALLGFPFKRSHSTADYLLVDLNHINESSTPSSAGDDIVTSGEVIFVQHLHDIDGNSSTSSLSLVGGHSKLESDFTILRGEYGRVLQLREISETTELKVEVNAQLGGSSTPRSHLFSLGGSDYLRGYASSEFAGESGIKALFEIGQLHVGPTENITQITPFAFFDVGYISNHSSSGSQRPKNDSLASIGIGSRMSAYGFYLDASVGVPLLEGHDGKTPSPAAYLRITKGW